MRLVSDKSQEEDHARQWDDTKLQLKQPKLTLDFLFWEGNAPVAERGWLKGPGGG